MTTKETTREVLEGETRMAFRDGVLTLREYAVLSLRFGFGFKENKQHTLEEVAQVWGVTRGRVHQIEDKAIAKIIRRRTK